MVSAGEVKVNITGDMRDLQIALRQAGQQVDNTADRMERRMQAAYGVLSRGAQVAGVAIAAGIGLAIREAAAAEEIRSRFDAVFGDLSVSTREWANETADAVARSSIALEQYLSTFQDTFVPLGATREEAAGLSQQLATLAVDLASFNNENEPETVRALQSAIVGNHETVRRYGVIINQARLEQELLNMGIEGGREAATELEAAQARLNIIMRGTSDAQGDAARTADSATNQWRSFTAELRDSAVAIGEEFMPAALIVLGWFEDLLPAVESAGVGVGNFFSQLVEQAQELATGIAIDPIGVDAIREDIEELQRLRDQATAIFMDGDSNGAFGGQLADLVGRGAMREAGAPAYAVGVIETAEELNAIYDLINARIQELRRGLPATMQEVAEATGDAVDETNDLADATDEAGRQIEHIYNMPQPWNPDPVQEFVDAIRAGNEAMEEMGAKGLPPIIDEMEEMKRAMADISEGAMKNLEDAFVDFARTGRLEIGNLVDYIIEQFARLAFQEWFAPQIQGGLESIIGGIGSVLGLGSAGAGGVMAGGKSGLAGAAQIINIDARYATEGTAAMIEKAFQTQGPQIVNTSVQASVQMVAGMNEAVSVT